MRSYGQRPSTPKNLLLARGSVTVRVPLYVHSRNHVQLGAQDLGPFPGFHFILTNITGRLLPSWRACDIMVLSSGSGVGLRAARFLNDAEKSFSSVQPSQAPATSRGAHIQTGHLFCRSAFAGSDVLFGGHDGHQRRLRGLWKAPIRSTGHSPLIMLHEMRTAAGRCRPAILRRALFPPFGQHAKVVEAFDSRIAPVRGLFSYGLFFSNAFDFLMGQPYGTGSPAKRAAGRLCR